MSCQNGIAPLQLPISNVTVSSDGRSVSRGIEFGIGTPQQIVSLGISLSDSDTFVFNQAQCNSSIQAICSGRLGGMYDPEASSSYTKVTRAQWNGTTDKELFTAANYIFFQEHIQYGANISSTGFPLFMSSGVVESQGGIGLGNASTILTHTYESKQSPSTAFGLYAGSRNIQSPEDGLLVIGGWDTARVDGELTDMNYTDACPNCFIVDSLTYTAPDGGSEDLITEPLGFQLESAIRTIWVPQDAYNRFTNFTGATPQANGSLTMPIDAPLGNLTARLANGYESVIPADQLFTKPRDYNEKGEYEIYNHESTLVQLQNVTVPDDAVIFARGVLGLPFLSQNYVVMDHVKRQFRMGKAKRSDSNQVLLGAAPEVVIESICPDDDAPPSSSSGGGGSSNAGAIAGGVVGGILGLALIAFAIWFWRRRQRRATAAASTKSNDNTPGGVTSDEETLSPPAYEKDPKPAIPTGSSNDPAEISPTVVDGGDDPRYSLSELPSARDIDGLEGKKVQELPAPMEGEEGRVGAERKFLQGPVELPT
jgi:hypothetical protein